MSHPSLPAAGTSDPAPEFLPWDLASEFVACWSELSQQQLRHLLREQVRNWRHWLELRNAIPRPFTPHFSPWPSPEPVALLLTGSRSLCRELLDEGYRLLPIHSPRERERAREWGRRHFPGGSLFPVECDLGDSAEAEALLRRVRRDHGAPDLLLIDGRSGAAGAATRLHPEVLLGWIYNLLQASLPVMEPRRAPRIRFLLDEETDRVLSGFSRQLTAEMQGSGILIETSP